MIITILVSYLLGSIPFGLLLTRYAGLGDIRDIGSGNIGATNVLRTGNKKLAAATLLLDGIKGFVAVWIGYEIGATIGYAIVCSLIGAVGAVLGHMFPVWLKFKGGKGVATSIGAFMALSWMLGLCVIGLWLLVFAVTRISSLSAIMGMLFAPVVALLVGERWLILAVLPIAALVIWRHKDNIRRLANGTEPRFGKQG